MAYSDFVRHKKWSIISIGSIWSRILLSSQIEYLQTNTEYKKNLNLRREGPKVDGYNMVQINNAKDNKKFTTCWSGKLWLIQHQFHMGITTCHLNSCENSCAIFVALDIVSFNVSLPSYVCILCFKQKLVSASLWTAFLGC